MDCQKLMTRIQVRLLASDTLMQGAQIVPRSNVRRNLALAIDDAATLLASLHVEDRTWGRPLISALVDAVSAPSEQQALEDVENATEILARWAAQLEVELP